MSFGVDRRRSSDLALLWLWCGPKAIAPIQPLVWEPPLPCGPKKQENKTKQDKTKQKTPEINGISVSIFLTLLP